MGWGGWVGRVVYKLLTAKGRAAKRILKSALLVSVLLPAACLSCFCYSQTSFLLLFSLLFLIPPPPSVSLSSYFSAPLFPSALYHNHPRRKAPPWESRSAPRAWDLSAGSSKPSFRCCASFPSRMAIITPSLSHNPAAHSRASEGFRTWPFLEADLCSWLPGGHINLASAAAVFRQGWPHRIISRYGWPC